MADRKTFTVTEDHVKLTKRMFVGWQDCETGAPEIDPKRPYGNSDVAYDIAEILGWQLDDELTTEQKSAAAEIHREMEFVVQIGLQCGHFTPGEYVEVRYSEWEPLGAHQPNTGSVVEAVNRAVEDLRDGVMDRFGNYRDLPRDQAEHVADRLAAALTGEGAES